MRGVEQLAKRAWKPDEARPLNPPERAASFALHRVFSSTDLEASALLAATRIGLGSDVYFRPGAPFCSSPVRDSYRLLPVRRDVGSGTARRRLSTTPRPRNRRTDTRELFTPVASGSVNFAAPCMRVLSPSRRTHRGQERTMTVGGWAHGRRQTQTFSPRSCRTGRLASPRDAAQCSLLRVRLHSPPSPLSGSGSPHPTPRA